MSARPGTPTARGRVEVIDYLRLAAALAVMCFHYLYNGIRNGRSRASATARSRRSPPTATWACTCSS